MNLFDQLYKSWFAVVEVVGSGFVGHFEVDAKVLGRVECSSLMLQYSQVFAVTVVPRHSQVSEVVFDLEAMQSLVTVVESLK